VIHGKDDSLVSYQSGEHAAEMVDGAKLMLIDEMGRNLGSKHQAKIRKKILPITSEVG